MLVTRKPMKSLRIKVDRQANIKVSCPPFVTDLDILAFMNEKRDWILKQLANVSLPQSKTSFAHNDNVNLWGQTYRLVVQQGLKNHVVLNQATAEICLVQKHSQPDLISKQLNEFYRRELKIYISAALPFWEQQINVRCDYWNIKNMRSKWGSCNVTKKRVWLSLNLAKYPKECAQMVLVHELTHLLEASHNHRFYQLMDNALPDWRAADKLLQPG